MTENNDFNNTENDSTNSRNEKRFKLSEPNGAYLIDNDEPKYHWINDDDKIVECLNALHEENKILKNKIGTYHSTHKLLKETIDRLRDNG